MNCPLCSKPAKIFSSNYEDAPCTIYCVWCCIEIKGPTVKDAHEMWKRSIEWFKSRDNKG